MARQEGWGGEERRGPGALAGHWRRPWLPLVPVTVLVTVLAAAGALPRWSGLPHLVALPPLDMFADLRAILTRAPSVPTFILLVVVVLAARIAVLALMLGGPTRQRVVLAATFYATLAPLYLLAAQLTFLANALLYARLFWPSVGTVLAVAFLTAALPWQRVDRLRDVVPAAWRSGLRVDVLLPYAFAVATIGALAEALPALTIPLIPVSAAATCAAVAGLSRPPRGRPLRHLAAFSAVALVAGTVFVLTRAPDNERGPGDVRAGTQREGSIMVMSGIDSRSGSGTMFETRTDVLGYRCDQTYYFSYAGPGAGQPRGSARCPIRTGAPYTGDHTQRPMAEQIEAFSQQVRDLPRPLVVAGHSHGAWVAWKAVARGAAPEVDALILVGPFPESTVGYRPFGVDGPGRVASDLVHILVPLAEEVDFHFDPDAPAAYELQARATTEGTFFDEPVPPDVRVLSVTASTDLPLMPAGWRLPVEQNACPMRAPHPYLPDTVTYYAEVNRFLDGRPALPCPPWRDWGAVLTVPYSVPSAPG